MPFDLNDAPENILNALEQLVTEIEDRLNVYVNKPVEQTSFSQIILSLEKSDCCAPCGETPEYGDWIINQDYEIVGNDIKYTAYKTNNLDYYDSFALADLVQALVKSFHDLDLQQYTAFTSAVEQLLGAVDWVLDPANNQIKYYEEDPNNLPQCWMLSDGTGCYATASAAANASCAKSNLGEATIYQTGTNYAYATCSGGGYATVLLNDNPNYDPNSPSLQYYYVYALWGANTKVSSIDEACILAFTAGGWAGYDIPPLPEGYGCSLDGNSINAYHDSNYFGQIGYRVENPAYDPEAEDEREKTIPLETVAEKIVSNAETSADEVLKLLSEDYIDLVAESIFNIDISKQFVKLEDLIPQLEANKLLRN